MAASASAPASRAASIAGGHGGHVVERVEDPEEVDAGVRGLLHEAGAPRCRVVGVADRVRAAEQHLEQDVRDLLPQQRQPLPRVLVQEPHRHVEGRAAPHLHGEQLGELPRHRRRDARHVVGAHPRGQQRLVRVAERGVGDQQPFLSRTHGAEPLDTQLLQPLPRRRAVARHPRHRRGPAAGHLAWWLGLPPERRAAASLGASVGLPFTVISPMNSSSRVARSRRGANRNSAGVSSMKVVVQRPCWKVGWATTFCRNGMLVFTPRTRNSGEPSLQAAARLDEVEAPGGELDQQGVVERGDHRAGEGGAAIQADAEAGRGAVVRDPAVVGGEVVGRVLGRDPALDGVAAHLDRVLVGMPDLRVGERHAPRRPGSGTSRCRRR